MIHVLNELKCVEAKNVAVEQKLRLAKIYAHLHPLSSHDTLIHQTGLIPLNLHFDVLGCHF